MRRILYFVHTTADGRMATGDGGLWQRFAWGDAEMGLANGIYRDADTWVLGRRMYESLVPWWDAVAAGRSAGGDARLTANEREFARLLAGMTKIVLSTRLAPSAANTRVVRDDPAAWLETAKQQPGREMLLSCGPDLLGRLSAHRGLIDEFYLVLHPVLLGRGKPLLRTSGAEVPLDFLEARPLPAGALLLQARARG